MNVRGSTEDDDGRAGELRELCISAGAIPVASITAKLHAPTPALYIGRGKVAEIKALVCDHEADVVIFGQPLSPAQERNLERELGCRALDRISLILDIFAQRASTFEGKLQVELAQLRHLSTRLVRGWTHLERQKGGIGLRGPGEKQLETDRRLLAMRIARIDAELEKVRRRRALSRRARRRAEVPVVSLVGYTNAGKSTLFNRLSGGHVGCADRLFVTLDPTLRRIELGAAASCIVADTVGFIRDLPPALIAAFRATLEETLQASVLLHVIDASDPRGEEKKGHVNDVLADIGADRIAQIEVYNKLDRCPAGARTRRCEAHSCARSGRRPERVWISSKTGEGIDALLSGLGAHVARAVVRRRVRLPPGSGRLRARLFQLGSVVEERTDERGMSTLEIVIRPESLKRLCREDGLEAFLAGDAV